MAEKAHVSFFRNVCFFCLFLRNLLKIYAICEGFPGSDGAYYTTTRNSRELQQQYDTAMLVEDYTTTKDFRELQHGLPGVPPSQNYTTTRDFGELQQQYDTAMLVNDYTTTRDFRELQHTETAENCAYDYTTTKDSRELQHASCMAGDCANYTTAKSYNAAGAVGLAGIIAYL